MSRAWDRFEIAGERISSCTLPSGLPLVVIEKPGFVKRFAAFGVRYGAFDRAFVPPGGDRQVVVPDGVAHFLEHCVFEGRDGNALEVFSRRGAMVNAGTSYLFTYYYFSATEKLEENLTDLLTFVRTPHITEQNVRKEQGIIEQEIRMYEDMPEDAKWRLLLGALFARHPIRNHIAGTVESIRAVTADVLATCFEAFYRPENMILCVVGDQDPEAVRDQAASSLLSLPEWCRLRGKPRRVAVEEPPEPAESEAARTMPVGLPKAVLGFKEVTRSFGGRALLEREIASDLAVEALFGRASRNFRLLYEEGLIDESFFAVAATYPELGFAALGGDTPKPEQLFDRLNAMAERAASDLTEEDFQRVKKKFTGEFIRRFNTVEFLGSACLSYLASDITLQDVWAVLKRIEHADVQKRAGEIFRPDRSAKALIEPPSSTYRRA